MALTAVDRLIVELEFRLFVSVTDADSSPGAKVEMIAKLFKLLKEEHLEHYPGDWEERYREGTRYLRSAPGQNWGTYYPP